MVKRFLKNLLLKRPFLVVFDVTKRCNSRCSMCSIWKNQSKVSDELTLKQMKSIFSDLKSFGVKQVFIQGGEPLLRSDIFKVVKLLISLGLSPTIITNGILLDKMTASKLSRLKCNVSISFDTLKRDRYIEIRGVKTFDLVKNNIISASRIKRKRGKWFINSTISEVNYDEVVDLYDFAFSNGFHFSAFPYNYSLCKASARDEELVFKNMDKVIKAFNKLVKKSRQAGDIINELVFNEVIKYLKSGYKAPCDALRYSIMLDEMGRVGPCIELPYEFDLKNKSISDVWPRFNRDRVKSCYLKTPCFYGCTRGSGVVVSNWFKILGFILKNPGEAKQLFKML